MAILTQWGHTDNIRKDLQGSEVYRKIRKCRVFQKEGLLTRPVKELSECRKYELSSRRPDLEIRYWTACHQQVGWSDSRRMWVDGGNWVELMVDKINWENKYWNERLDRHRHG